MCALKVGLKLCEIELIVTTEDVYDQLLNQNIFKDDHIYKQIAQTSLEGFT